MGLFGKNKTFKIYGLEDCRVSINGMDISAFIDKKVKTLEYDGVDIYANDTCISRYLKDEYSYNVKFEQKNQPKKEESKPTPKPQAEAKPKEPEKPKVDLVKAVEKAKKEIEEVSSPISLESLNIVIQGNIGGIESDGNLTVSGRSIGQVDCCGNLAVECNSIEGNISSENDISIKGSVKGSVACEGNATISGDVNGDISVEGNATIKGNVTTQGNINLDGAFQVGGSVDAHEISAEGNITISGNSSGQLSAEGDISIKGAWVGESITAGGNVNLSK